ncbi:3-oxoacyl-ACP synthase [Streptomyces armeniacus]|uniref:3-oxoacyl-ACP synthase n=1 Tax=Streptomyces armeniacus TaxID=83291 RepID=A0A345XP02_9ACTN|nr:ketoacyl-ACP synthase III family protein [Streptomyces armeniacus]AXK33368.1 3-oxoacyl-ACP synthase [Streptomyces armeniacus]
MRTTDVFVKGIGVCLPEPVSVEWAVAQGLHPAGSAAAHGLTGATVAGDVPAPEMALRAAEDACKRGGQRPDEVDLLLYTDTWHQGPDGWQPQYYLQRHLVGDGVLAVETQHGCNGMFSALELAAAYLGADDARRAALIVSADNYGTPLVDRWNAGPGFVVGDAAASVVLSRDEGFARLLSVGSVTVPDGEELHRAGEPLFPPGATTGSTMDFNVRAAAFLAEAKARASAAGGGPSLWLRVHQKLAESVHRALAEADVELADIARVIFMNNDRETVGERCMGALGLPLSKSTWEYGRTVGHLGASDQIVSLNHLLETGELGPGDRVLLAGMAPGVTLSSAVVEIVGTPPWLG